MAGESYGAFRCFDVFGERLTHHLVQPSARPPPFRQVPQNPGVVVIPQWDRFIGEAPLHPRSREKGPRRLHIPFVTDEDRPPAKTAQTAQGRFRIAIGVRPLSYAAKMTLGEKGTPLIGRAIVPQAEVGTRDGPAREPG